MRKKENANPGMPIQKSDKIFVAGHRGMVGSALTRALEASGFTNLLKRDRIELDLGDDGAVTKFFVKEKPEIVIFAAASFCSKICAFKTTSSPRPTRMAHANFCFLVARASIPSSRRNRSRRAHYSPDRSSRRTKLTPSQKLPA